MIVCAAVAPQLSFENINMIAIHGFKAGTALTSATLLALLTGIVLGGCGAESKTPTQVAARVNNREITVHQINDSLGPVEGRDAAQVKKIGEQALDRLINQELLVQKAMAARLDREPRVVSALENARREVLARAYLESVASAVPPPSPEDVARFRDSHPELFKDRRVYQLQELQIRADAAQRKQIGDKVASRISVADLATWLKSQNIQFTANAGVRGPESVPLAMTPRLGALNDGDSVSFDSEAGVTVIHLIKSQKAPIPEDLASTAVAQYLRTVRGKEAAENEIKDLHVKARIEYVGMFAPSPGTSRADPADPSVSNVASAGPSERGGEPRASVQPPTAQP